MSKVSLEMYGRWAKIKDPLYATGRPPQARSRARLILADVVKKLDIQPDDRLLDIGSGIGSLTIPLSFQVADVLAIDHPACLERLKQRAPEEPIRTLPGNFIDVDITESFNKILVYSVVHYLTSSDELLAFVDKALKLLERHGRMLIGDLPNDHVKMRFEKTAEGEAYAHSWNKAFEQFGTVTTQEDYDALEPFDTARKRDHALAKFNDNVLISLLGGIRQMGFHAWLLPQPVELPMGPWREDLLIVRP